MTTKETAAATTTKQAAARQRAFAQLDATFRSGVTRPLRWRKAQLDAMARMLRQNATVIARAVRADLGKPAAETALMEIGLVLDEIRFIKPRLGRWAARHPKPMHYLLQPAVGWTVAEPKGVALIISPWNYPVLLSFEPMADAIAAGNCVCMKPSELSPHTSGVMADLIARYMDPQAFRMVQGGPQETTKLLEQPFNHIFYTGGGKVGSIVMAAAAKHLTPVTLELGGKSPVFVDRTANLDVAARRIAWGRFINAGQTCVAPDYVLTTSDVIEPLAGKIAEAVTRFFGSDPQHSDSFGRIINARPRPLAAYAFTGSKRVRRMFEREVSCGALGFNLPLGHLISSRLPFGGVGASGMGSYHGKAGFLEFSHVKTVVGKPAVPDTLSLVYPPYDGLKKILISAVSHTPRVR